MEDHTLITTINSEMNLALPLHIGFEAMRHMLQAAVNKMIEKDFQQLVSLLYRIDVNEIKLKYLLHENVGEDAAVIIADLIIERQIEKIKTRAEFSKHNDDETGDEDKW